MSRIRRSIEELESEHKKGNTKPLDDVMRAFEGVQKKQPDDPDSFQTISGYHGAPFRGAGWGNASWWGGYCMHGNVLFPTWHRAYLLRLEDALRTVVPDVAMPYWDETSTASVAGGLPASFTALKWKFADGREIDNPLRSFKLAAPVWDNVDVGPKASSYTKHTGYETVRYPFSGLVGSPEDAAATQQLNESRLAQYGGIAGTDKLLNDNVSKWLNRFINPGGGLPRPTNTAEKYRRCLDAPNYTVFSNTTSAANYNQTLFDENSWAPGSRAVVPLEQPHNDMHLAIGGFDIPEQGNFDELRGANGDMGENDTAAFDPVFYFHHAFIDKVFWDWQSKHHDELNTKNVLTIIDKYPGTNTVDSQGPTPGVAANIWLTVDSPLEPFETKPGSGIYYKTKDLVNIIEQLGYDYAPPLPPQAEQPPAPPLLPPTHEMALASLGGDRDHWRKLQREVEDAPGGLPVLRIDGIDRAAYAGSFAVHVDATVRTLRNGGPEHSDESFNVASDGVLSRWRVGGCANCQTHLGYRSYMPLPKALAQPLAPDDPLRAHAPAGDAHSKDSAGRVVAYNVHVQQRWPPGPDGKHGLMSSPKHSRISLGFIGGTK